MTAGNGLVGGGTLAANMTLTVDLTAASGLEFVSGDLQIANSLAGLGLTRSAAKALDVSAGDGIRIVADQVAVDTDVVRTSRTITSGTGITGGGDLGSNLTLNVVGGIRHPADVAASGWTASPNSGLTVSASGLTMGLPTTLDVATTNLVTGNTHAHNIDSTADAYTQPDKILHAAGSGLTLGSLNVRGAVTITDGGEFTVGPNIFYVNNTSDPSTSHVGINWVGDPQFALDVNGPIRGQYLVGPHALQVKDVMLLSHFDGKEPYNTNAFRRPEQRHGPGGRTEHIGRHPESGLSAWQILQGCGDHPRRHQSGEQSAV